MENEEDEGAAAFYAALKAEYEDGPEADPVDDQGRFLLDEDEYSLLRSVFAGDPNADRGLVREASSPGRWSFRYVNPSRLLKEGKLVVDENGDPYRFISAVPENADFVVERARVYRTRRRSDSEGSKMEFVYSGRVY